ncbi:GPR endopeptidase [Lachnospiraceae bacterium NSJ-143]|nr:GPR endopeptidase [Lachnospiraceae bacterium NSJ-143]
MKNSRNIRTDLALEAREAVAGKDMSEIDGVNILSSEDDIMTVTQVEIVNEKGSEALGKPQGKYITIESQSLRENDIDAQKKITMALSEKIKELVEPEKHKKVLIVGLGNWNVTPDALGPKVVKRILVTRHILDSIPEDIKDSVGNVAAVSPGVLGITGIETAEIIKGIVEKVKPDAVVAIDALAARSISRINSTIQLSDTGINPGAGIGNSRSPLNRDTLGVPVIAIGVPTVVDAATLVNDTFDGILISMAQKDNEDKRTLKCIEHICSEDKFEDILNALEPYSGNMFVTPKEVDAVIERLSDVIANAVNIVLHPVIDIDDVKNFSF